MDGDFLSCILIESIKYIFSQFSSYMADEFKKTIKIGVICTAYSNGSFMKKIQNDKILHDMQVELVIAKTGVKYLSEKADNFDIAVEFEANGHGKITLNNKINNKLSRLNSFCGNSTDILFLELLSSFLALFNPTVGDSISVMLGVEASLKLLNRNIEDFSNLFVPLEFCYGKVNVLNKNSFICNDNETKLIEPNIIQDYIDSLEAKNSENMIRAFIRPSGTENVVRVYVEGKDKEIIDSIRKELEEYLIKHYS